MAQIPPAQVKRVLEFVDIVEICVRDNTNTIVTEDQARNTALAVLQTMSHAGIGLTFPDPPPKEEEPPF